MNYATIKPSDVANGPGVRVSLFVSGCTHKCKGCFNSEAWDFSFGEEFTDVQKQIIFDRLKLDYIEGFSLLGGEPFEPQNAKVLAPFLSEIKQNHPDKSIWCYSGYLFDELKNGSPSDDAKKMLESIDILVDGEFEEDKKDLHLRFRGSANQRIIDVKKSLKDNDTVIWDGVLYI